MSFSPRNVWRVEGMADLNKVERLVNKLLELYLASTKGAWTIEYMDGYITGRIISPVHTYSGTARSEDAINLQYSLTRHDAEYIAESHNLLQEFFGDTN